MAKQAGKPLGRIRHARTAAAGPSKGTMAVVLFSLSVLLSSAATAARDAGYREVVLFCSFTAVACFVSTFVVLARREARPR